MNEFEHKLWMDFHERNKNPLWRLDKSHHGLTNADLNYGEAFGNVIEVKANPWHLEGTVYTHTAMVFQEAMRLTDKFVGDKNELLFSALAHDLGKPFMRGVDLEKEKVSFMGHDYTSALMCLNWGKEYFGETELLKIAKAVALHTTMFKVDDISPYIDFTDLHTLLRGLSVADNKGRFSLSEEDDRNPKYDADQDDRHPDLHWDKDKPWLTVMIGIPGSGKSTVAERYGKVFSTDALLEDIAEKEFGVVGDYGKAFQVVSESKFNWVEMNLLNAEKYAKENSGDIVIDATNLVRKKRRGIVNRFKKNFNIRFVKVWRDFEDCRKSRLKNSGKFISDAIYRRMLYSFAYPTREEYTHMEDVLV